MQSPLEPEAARISALYTNWKNTMNTVSNTMADALALAASATKSVAAHGKDIRVDGKN